MSTNTTSITLDHEIVIVGSGFSGLGAGIQLKKMGLDNFVILERANDLGGTWRDNTYPGLTVDVASTSYSYGFELSPEWTRLYAPGAQVKAYADHCAQKYGLAAHLRYGCAVVGATYQARHPTRHVDPQPFSEHEPLQLYPRSGELGGTQSGRRSAMGRAGCPTNF